MRAIKYKSRFNASPYIVRREDMEDKDRIRQAFSYKRKIVTFYPYESSCMRKKHTSSNLLFLKSYKYLSHLPLFVLLLFFFIFSKFLYM